MALESFNAYHSYLKAMEPLNDAERGRLFTACLQYSMTGEAPELTGKIKAVKIMSEWRIPEEEVDRLKRGE